MLSIFFALLSFIGWGVTDIFGVIVTRKIGSFATVFWGSLFGLLISALYIPFALPELQNLTLNIFLLNTLLGIILLVGMVSFYEAFRQIQASIVGVITASGFALVPIFSIIFLHESISLFQTIAIVVIFIGVFLTTFSAKDIKSKKFKLNKGFIWAFVTMLCWGIYYTFIKIPIHEIGWFWPNYFYLIMAIPLILIFIKWKKIPLKKPNYHGAFRPLIINVLLMKAGEYSFNFSLMKGSAAITAPIAGSYPVLFVILAFLVFKDPVSKQQITGIITTLAGIILLSFLSV